MIWTGNCFGRITIWFSWEYTHNPLFDIILWQTSITYYIFYCSSLNVNKVNDSIYSLCEIAECNMGIFEWLLFNAKWAMFELYHGKNNYHFNDVSCVLYKHAQLDFYSTSSLNNRQQIDMSLHLDTDRYVAPLGHR
jgi:hypothetical protein